MAKPKQKRVSSTVADVIGASGQPDAPGAAFDANRPDGPRYDTIADEARKSAVVSQAHAEWVESVGPLAPTMHPDGPSAYPENTELIDASPEQIAALGVTVRERLRG